MANINNEAAYEGMKRRYEQLKRQWFYGQQIEVDDEGIEMPSNAPDRTQLAQMFQNMGVEIPMSPDSPMTQTKVVQR